MPKLKMTIIQYLWCWICIVLIRNVPLSSMLDISGLWVYLYKGSLSLIAISMLLKYGGKNYLVFAISSLEVLAILLQLGSCYANLTKEVNWFYTNYRVLNGNIYSLEVILLTIAGIYGFGLLVWSTYNRVSRDRGGNSFKSVVYSLLFEERRGQHK